MRIKCLQQTSYSMCAPWDHQAEVHGQVLDKKDRITWDGAHSPSCMNGSHWFLLSCPCLDRVEKVPRTIQLVSKDST